MKKNKAIGWVKTAVCSLLLLFLGSGCAAVGGLLGNGPAPTATPPGNSISYTVPVYSETLQPGETVMGTQLTYIDQVDGTYQVSINGLAATKRTGGSFVWEGVVAPGVFGNYNLRLTTALLGGLTVAGPVEVVVFNPTPQAIENPPESADFVYSNIGINYRIPAGRELPGTPLVYQGVSNQLGGNACGTTVNDLAVFTGLEGYPCFAVGDSLVWTGTLSQNVTVRYSLFARSVTAEEAVFTGTAELWVNE